MRFIIYLHGKRRLYDVVLLIDDSGSVRMLANCPLSWQTYSSLPDEWA